VTAATHVEFGAIVWQLAGTTSNAFEFCTAYASESVASVVFTSWMVCSVSVVFGGILAKTSAAGVAVSRL
jgi:hypothetical protein